LTDPSTDLAVAIALASAYAGLPLPATTVVVGEVGLAGDLRPISGMDRRLTEAARLGFTTALTPPGAPATVGGLRTVAAANIVAALHHLVDIADHRADRPAPPQILRRV
jgi:DNA repair protein RadA/Sms